MFDTIEFVNYRFKIILVCVVTIALYGSAILFFSSARNFDTDSYFQIGSLTLTGINIYPDPAISRHPYLPFFLFLEAGAVYLGAITPFSASVILKMFFTLFHLFSVYSVYILSKKNTAMSFLYAINPISLLIIAFHGQFDIIPLSLLLCAVILVTKKKYVVTLFLLSLAITIKTWPILFIIPFLKRIPPRFFPVLLIIPISTVVAYMVFFDTSLWSIIRVLLVYQGVQGVWGIGQLVSLLALPKVGLIGIKTLFVAIMLYVAFRQRKSQIIDEVTQLILVFFLITPGFGIQWFIWIVPFIFLSKTPYIGMLAVPILIVLVVTYMTWLPLFAQSLELGTMALSFLYPLFLGYYIIQKKLLVTSRL